MFLAQLPAPHMSCFCTTLPWPVACFLLTLLLYLSTARLDVTLYDMMLTYMTYTWRCMYSLGIPDDRRKDRPKHEER